MLVGGKDDAPVIVDCVRISSICAAALLSTTCMSWLAPSKSRLSLRTLLEYLTGSLVKLALEPEWEATFEPNSYGFRPGRSCHDAIKAIRLAIRIQSKYALDADIAKCFDRINHEALLEKLNTFPSLKRLIRACLKAGVMEGKKLFPTEEGAPQGGVISPILANRALHGLETSITSAYPARKMKDGKEVAWRPKVIRYADDFLVLHRDLTVIKEVQQMASEWLTGIRFGPHVRVARLRRPETGLGRCGRCGLSARSGRPVRAPAQLCISPA